MLVPAILAGGLGLLAHAAGDDAAYVPRLRVVCLGAAALGYLGIAVFVWRTARGWRRVLTLLAGLVAVRACYLPVLGLSVFLAGWLEWLARALGAGALSGPVHYALGCLLGALAGLFTLLGVAAVNHVRSPAWALVGVALLALAVLAFAHPEDRAILPHPVADTTPLPSTSGPGYLDVVKDGGAPLRARVLAAFGGARHALSPRSGWAGAVREELLAQFRDRPDASHRARVSSLERALLRARPALRTSPRTPPGS